MPKYCLRQRTKLHRRFIAGRRLNCWFTFGSLEGDAVRRQRILRNNVQPLCLSPGERKAIAVFLLETARSPRPSAKLTLSWMSCWSCRTVLEGFGSHWAITSGLQARSSPCSMVCRSCHLQDTRELAQLTPPFRRRGNFCSRRPLPPKTHRPNPVGSYMAYK